MKQLQKRFIPVMLTPFKKDGSLDYDGLTKLTEFYLECGAGGLFANCLSSEMYELTPGERLNLIRHVVRIANGAVPVVATGTFGGEISEQAAFVRAVYEEGAQAVIVITSLLAGESESEEVFTERTHALLDATPGIPLGFYECPVPYKRVLSAAQLGRFVATGRVVYHKDTSLDINRIKAKLRAADNSSFGLYDAYMVHAVKSLQAGSAGLSCIQGNFFPELIAWLCRHYDTPGLEKEVEQVQQFLTDNMKVMHYAYPSIAKYFLQKRGLSISGFTRRKTDAVTKDVVQDIDALYDRYTIFQKQIMPNVAV